MMSPLKSNNYNTINLMIKKIMWAKVRRVIRTNVNIYAQKKVWTMQKIDYFKKILKSDYYQYCT